MKEIRCPYCQKLLFKGNSANVEIKCQGCKKIIKIKLVSQLTSLYFN